MALGHPAHKRTHDGKRGHSTRIGVVVTAAYGAFTMSGNRSRPTLTYERRLWAEGFQLVAGLDEAGRGAWAGPVVAAAVILPAGEPDLAQHLDGVRDSKTLSAARREQLLLDIQR